MAGFSDFSVRKFQARLRLMTDEQLLRTGKRLKALMEEAEGRKRRLPEVFSLQLQAAREEWKRRQATEARKSSSK